MHATFYRGLKVSAKMVLWLILCLGADVAPARGQNQVWFAPNGAGDYMNLFAQPERWPIARSKISGMLFHQWQIVVDACPPMCVTDELPFSVLPRQELFQAQVFSKLDSWGIQTAIGVGPLDGRCFVDTRDADVAIRAIDAILNNGGRVHQLVVDEPWTHTVSSFWNFGCYSYSMDQNAAQVASFIKLVKARHPSVLIGIVEAYPGLSPSQMKDWIHALEKYGAKLDFFDLDWFLPDHKEADMKDLQAFFEGKKIPLGMIIWGGNRQTSDKGYYDWAMNLAKATKAAIGLPQRILFESWTINAVTEKSTIPINLPENDPAIYSHTRLINDGLAVLTGVSTPPPARADTTVATVSITAPADCDSVSGSGVTVSAGASDDVGVAGVQFELDGASVGTEDQSGG